MDSLDCKRHAAQAKHLICPQCVKDDIATARREALGDAAGLMPINKRQFNSSTELLAYASGWRDLGNTILALIEPAEGGEG